MFKYNYDLIKIRNLLKKFLWYGYDINRPGHEYLLRGNY